MTLPNWQPPQKKIPSESYLGERDKDALHVRVGSAINEWEILESALARIFAPWSNPEAWPPFEPMERSPQDGEKRLT